MKNATPVGGFRRRSTLVPFFGILLAIFLFLAPGIFPSPISLRATCEAATKPTEESAGSPGRVEAKKPRKKEVIIYVTSWCPACKMTMDYLRKKNIPFVAKDVEKNDAYMREMIEKVGSFRGVPVLDINGRIFLGFNPYVLDELTK